MNRPKPMPGWCPFYCQSSNRCYLSEGTPDSGTRDYKCKSDYNCKTCGNYDAWKSGSNYRGK